MPTAPLGWRSCRRCGHLPAPPPAACQPSCIRCTAYLKADRAAPSGSRSYGPAARPLSAPGTPRPPLARAQDRKLRLQLLTGGDDDRLQLRIAPGSPAARRAGSGTGSGSSSSSSSEESSSESSESSEEEAEAEEPIDYDQMRDMISKAYAQADEEEEDDAAMLAQHGCQVRR